MCAGEAGEVSELGNARVIRQASQDTIGVAIRSIRQAKGRARAEYEAGGAS